MAEDLKENWVFDIGFSLNNMENLKGIDTPLEKLSKLDSMAKSAETAIQTLSESSANLEGMIKNADKSATSAKELNAKFNKEQKTQSRTVVKNTKEQLDEVYEASTKKIDSLLVSIKERISALSSDIPSERGMLRSGIKVTLAADRLEKAAMQINSAVLSLKTLGNIKVGVFGMNGPERPAGQAATPKTSTGPTTSSTVSSAESQINTNLDFFRDAVNKAAKSVENVGAKVPEITKNAQQMLNRTSFQGGSINPQTATPQKVPTSKDDDKPLVSKFTNKGFSADASVQLNEVSDTFKKKFNKQMQRELLRLGEEASSSRSKTPGVTGVSVSEEKMDKDVFGSMKVANDKFVANLNKAATAAEKAWVALHEIGHARRRARGANLTQQSEESLNPNQTKSNLRKDIIARAKATAQDEGVVESTSFAKTMDIIPKKDQIGNIQRAFGLKEDMARTFHKSVKTGVSGSDKEGQYLKNIQNIFDDSVREVPGMDKADLSDIRKQFGMHLRKIAESEIQHLNKQLEGLIGDKSKSVPGNVLKDSLSLAPVAQDIGDELKNQKKGKQFSIGDTNIRYARKYTAIDEAASANAIKATNANLQSGADVAGYVPKNQELGSSVYERAKNNPGQAFFGPEAVMDALIQKATGKTVKELGITRGDESYPFAEQLVNATSRKGEDSSMHGNRLSSAYAVEKYVNEEVPASSVNDLEFKRLSKNLNMALKSQTPEVVMEVPENIKPTKASSESGSKAMVPGRRGTFQGVARDYNEAAGDEFDFPSLRSLKPENTVPAKGEKLSKVSMAMSKFMTQMANVMNDGSSVTLKEAQSDVNEMLNSNPITAAEKELKKNVMAIAEEYANALRKLSGGKGIDVKKVGKEDSMTTRQKIGTAGMNILGESLQKMIHGDPGNEKKASFLGRNDGEKRGPILSTGKDNDNSLAQMILKDSQEQIYQSSKKSSDGTDGGKGVQLTVDDVNRFLMGVMNKSSVLEPKVPGYETSFKRQSTEAIANNYSMGRKFVQGTTNPSVFGFKDDPARSTVRKSFENPQFSGMSSVDIMKSTGMGFDESERMVSATGMQEAFGKILKIKDNEKGTTAASLIRDNFDSLIKMSPNSSKEDFASVLQTKVKEGSNVDLSREFAEKLASLESIRDFIKHAGLLMAQLKGSEGSPLSKSVQKGLEESASAMSGKIRYAKKHGGDDADSNKPQEFLGKEDSEAEKNARAEEARLKRMTPKQLEREKADKAEIQRVMALMDENRKRQTKKKPLKEEPEFEYDKDMKKEEIQSLFRDKAPEGFGKQHFKNIKENPRHYGRFGLTSETFDTDKFGKRQAELLENKYRVARSLESYPENAAQSNLPENIKGVGAAKLEAINQFPRVFAEQDLKAETLRTDADGNLLDMTIKQFNASYKKANARLEKLRAMAKKLRAYTLETLEKSRQKRAEEGSNDAAKVAEGLGIETQRSKSELSRKKFLLSQTRGDYDEFVEGTGADSDESKYLEKRISQLTSEINKLESLQKKDYSTSGKEGRDKFLGSVGVGGKNVTDAKYFKHLSESASEYTSEMLGNPVTEANNALSLALGAATPGGELGNRASVSDFVTSEVRDKKDKYEQRTKVQDVPFDFTPQEVTTVLKGLDVGTRAGKVQGSIDKAVEDFGTATQPGLRGFAESQIDKAGVSIKEEDGAFGQKVINILSSLRDEVKTGKRIDVGRYKQDVIAADESSGKTVSAKFLETNANVEQALTRREQNFDKIKDLKKIQEPIAKEQGYSQAVYNASIRPDAQNDFVPTVGMKDVSETQSSKDVLKQIGKEFKNVEKIRNTVDEDKQPAAFKELTFVLKNLVEVEKYLTSIMKVKGAGQEIGKLGAERINSALEAVRPIQDVVGTVKNLAKTGGISAEEMKTPSFKTFLSEFQNKRGEQGRDSRGPSVTMSHVMQWLNEVSASSRATEAGRPVAVEANSRMTNVESYLGQTSRNVKSAKDYTLSKNLPNLTQEQEDFVTANQRNADEIRRNQELLKELSLARNNAVSTLKSENKRLNRSIAMYNESIKNLPEGDARIEPLQKKIGVAQKYLERGNYIQSMMPEKVNLGNEKEDNLDRLMRIMLGGQKNSMTPDEIREHASAAGVVGKGFDSETKQIDLDYSKKARAEALRNLEPMYNIPTTHPAKDAREMFASSVSGQVLPGGKVHGSSSLKADTSGRFNVTPEQESAVKRAILNIAGVSLGKGSDQYFSNTSSDNNIKLGSNVDFKNVREAVDSFAGLSTKDTRKALGDSGLSGGYSTAMMKGVAVAMGRVLDIKGENVASVPGEVPVAGNEYGYLGLRPDGTRATIEDQVARARETEGASSSAEQNAALKIEEGAISIKDGADKTNEASKKFTKQTELGLKLVENTKQQVAARGGGGTGGTGGGDGSGGAGGGGGMGGGGAADPTVIAALTAITGINSAGVTVLEKLTTHVEEIKTLLTKGIPKTTQDQAKQVAEKVTDKMGKAKGGDSAIPVAGMRKIQQTPVEELADKIDKAFPDIKDINALGKAKIEGFKGNKGSRAEKLKSISERMLQEEAEDKALANAKSMQGEKAGKKQTQQVSANTQALTQVSAEKSKGEKAVETLKKVETQSVKTEGKMGDIIKGVANRVVLYGGMSFLMYGLSNRIKQTVAEMLAFESAMTNVTKVMNPLLLNVELMSDAARDMGKEFGTSLIESAGAMTVFAQQGKSAAAVVELARASMLAANTTTLKGAEATEALTAALKQFNIEDSKAIAVLDAWNEVENRTAITSTNLANAIKQAGTAANVAGLTFDELNGFVSAVGSSTRQTGNELGRSFRYILSHIKTDEAVTAIQGLGIAVNNADGDFRDSFSIIQDLALRWKNLSSVQRQNAAIAIAGTRRYNTLLVLLNKWDDVLKATNYSLDSQGSTIKENEKVMETATKQVAQLKASMSGLFTSIGDAGGLAIFKTFTGLLTNAVDLSNKLPNSLKAGAAVIGTVVGGAATAIRAAQFSGLAGFASDSGRKFTTETANRKAVGNVAKSTGGLGFFSKSKDVEASIAKIQGSQANIVKSQTQMHLTSKGITEESTVYKGRLEEIETATDKNISKTVAWRQEIIGAGDGFASAGHRVGAFFNKYRGHLLTAGIGLKILAQTQTDELSSTGKTLFGDSVEASADIAFNTAVFGGLAKKGGSALAEQLSKSLKLTGKSATAMKGWGGAIGLAVIAAGSLAANYKDILSHFTNSTEQLDKIRQIEEERLKTTLDALDVYEKISKTIKETGSASPIDLQNLDDAKDKLARILPGAVKFDKNGKSAIDDDIVNYYLENKDELNSARKRGKEEQAFSDFYSKKDSIFSGISDTNFENAQEDIVESEKQLLKLEIRRTAANIKLNKAGGMNERLNAEKQLATINKEISKYKDEQLKAQKDIDKFSQGFISVAGGDRGRDAYKVQRGLGSAEDLQIDGYSETMQAVYRDLSAATSELEVIRKLGRATFNEIFKGISANIPRDAAQVLDEYGKQFFLIEERSKRGVDGLRHFQVLVDDLKTGERTPLSFGIKEGVNEGEVFKEAYKNLHEYMKINNLSGALGEKDVLFTLDKISSAVLEIPLKSFKKLFQSQRVILDEIKSGYKLYKNELELPIRLGRLSFKDTTKSLESARKQAATSLKEIQIAPDLLGAVPDGFDKIIERLKTTRLETSELNETLIAMKEIAVKGSNTISDQFTATLYQVQAIATASRLIKEIPQKFFKASERESTQTEVQKAVGGGQEIASSQRYAKQINELLKNAGLEGITIEQAKSKEEILRQLQVVSAKQIVGSFKNQNNVLKQGESLLIKQVAAAKKLKKEQESIARQKVFEELANGGELSIKILEKIDKESSKSVDAAKSGVLGLADGYKELASLLSDDVISGLGDEKQQANIRKLRDSFTGLSAKAKELSGEFKASSSKQLFQKVLTERELAGDTDAIKTKGSYSGILDESQKIAKEQEYLNSLLKNSTNENISISKVKERTKQLLLDSEKLETKTTKAVTDRIKTQRMLNAEIQTAIMLSGNVLGAQKSAVQPLLTDIESMVNLLNQGIEEAGPGISSEIVEAYKRAGEEMGRRKFNLELIGDPSTNKNLILASAQEKAAYDLVKGMHEAGFSAKEIFADVGLKDLAQASPLIGGLLDTLTKKEFNKEFQSASEELASAFKNDFSKQAKTLAEALVKFDPKFKPVLDVVNSTVAGTKPPKKLKEGSAKYFPSSDGKIPGGPDQAFPAILHGGERVLSVKEISRLEKMGVPGFKTGSATVSLVPEDDDFTKRSTTSNNKELMRTRKLLDNERRRAKKLGVSYSKTDSVSQIGSKIDEVLARPTRARQDLYNHATKNLGMKFEGKPTLQELKDVISKHAMGQSNAATSMSAKKYGVDVTGIDRASIQSGGHNEIKGTNREAYKIKPPTKDINKIAETLPVAGYTKGAKPSDDFIKIKPDGGTTRYSKDFRNIKQAVEIEKPLTKSEKRRAKRQQKSAKAAADKVFKQQVAEIHRRDKILASARQKSEATNVFNKEASERLKSAPEDFKSAQSNSNKNTSISKPATRKFKAITGPINPVTGKVLKKLPFPKGDVALANAGIAPPNSAEYEYNKNLLKNSKKAEAMRKKAFEVKHAKTASNSGKPSYKHALPNEYEKAVAKLRKNKATPTSSSGAKVPPTDAAAKSVASTAPKKEKGKVGSKIGKGAGLAFTGASIGLHGMNIYNKQKDITDTELAVQYGYLNKDKGLEYIKRYRIKQAASLTGMLGDAGFGASMLSKGKVGKYGARAALAADLGAGAIEYFGDKDTSFLDVVKRYGPSTAFNVFRNAAELGISNPKFLGPAAKMFGKKNLSLASKFGGLGKKIAGSKAGAVGGQLMAAEMIGQGVDFAGNIVSGLGHKATGAGISIIGKTISPSSLVKGTWNTFVNAKEMDRNVLNDIGDYVDDDSIINTTYQEGGIGLINFVGAHDLLAEAASGDRPHNALDAALGASKALSGRMTGSADINVQLLENAIGRLHHLSASPTGPHADANKASSYLRRNKKLIRDLAVYGSSTSSYNKQGLSLGEMVKNLTGDKLDQQPAIDFTSGDNDSRFKGWIGVDKRIKKAAIESRKRLKKITMERMEREERLKKKKTTKPKKENTVPNVEKKKGLSEAELQEQREQMQIDAYSKMLIEKTGMSRNMAKKTAAERSMFISNVNSPDNYLQNKLRDMHDLQSARDHFDTTPSGLARKRYEDRMGELGTTVGPKAEDQYEPKMGLISTKKVIKDKSGVERVYKISEAEGSSWAYDRTHKLTDNISMKTEEVAKINRLRSIAKEDSELQMLTRSKKRAARKSKRLTRWLEELQLAQDGSESVSSIKAQVEKRFGRLKKYKTGSKGRLPGGREQASLAVLHGQERVLSATEVDKFEKMGVPGFKSGSAYGDASSSTFVRANSDELAPIIQKFQEAVTEFKEGSSATRSNEVSGRVLHEGEVVINIGDDVRGLMEELRSLLIDAGSAKEGLRVGSLVEGRGVQ